MTTPTVRFDASRTIAPARTSSPPPSSGSCACVSVLPAATLVGQPIGECAHVPARQRRRFQRDEGLRRPPPGSTR